MATSAIKNLHNVIQAKAPTTGGVRYCCLFCNGNGYTNKEEDEQREIFNLLNDIGNLWAENFELKQKINLFDNEEEKMKIMNLGMEEFFTKIPLGNDSFENEQKVNTSSVTVEATADVKATDDMDKNREEDKLIKKDKLKGQWKKKEERMKKVIGQQQKLLKYSMNLKKEIACHAVPLNLWGHRTITWTPWALPLPPRPSLTAPRPRPPAAPRSRPTATPGSRASADLRLRPPASLLSSKGSRFTSKCVKPKYPKPFSIPFQPQPLRTFAMKSFIKPSPKLTPSVHTAPVQCAPLSFNIRPSEMNVHHVTREMFADAMDTDVSTDFASHPYYDHEKSNQLDESDDSTFHADIVATVQHHDDDEQSGHDADDQSTEDTSASAHEDDTIIAVHEDIAAYGDDTD